MIQQHEAQLLIHLHETNMLETFRRVDHSDVAGGNGLSVLHRVWRRMDRRGDALREMTTIHRAVGSQSPTVSRSADVTPSRRDSRSTSAVRRDALST